MQRESKCRFKAEEGNDTTVLAMLMRVRDPVTGKAWTDEKLSEDSQVPLATLKRLKAGKTGLRTNLETLLKALGVDAKEYRRYIEYVGAERVTTKPEQVAAEPVAQDSKPQLPPTPPTMFGRDDKIKELTAALTVPALPTILLHGWPGIGKTALSQAALWDEKIEQHFGDRRYWVRGERASSAAALLIEIALALGLPASSKENEVHATLHAQAPCVLVIDNLETPLHNDKAVCLSLLKQLGDDPGVALLASFRGEARDAGPFWQKRMSVDELLERPAMDLFASTADKQEWANDVRVRQTVREVERVPLAVILLANRARGSSLDRFRRDWERFRTDLISRDEHTDRESNWSISLRFSLESPRLTACPAALRLARIMGQFPDGLAEADAEALLSGEADDATDALRSVGLLTYVEPTARFRMLHPIREYLRDHLPPDAEEWQAMENNYINLLRKSGIGGGLDISLVPQARSLAAINNISKVLLHALDSRTPENAMNVMWEYGALVDAFGQGEILPLIKGARFAEQFAFSTQAADCLFMIGNIYLHTGEYEQARIHFDRAQPLFQNTKNKGMQAQYLNSVGDLYLLSSDYEQSQIYLDKALAIFKSISKELSQTLYKGVGSNLGKVVHQSRNNNLGMANCLYSIGNLHLRKSEYEQAYHHFKRALSSFRMIANKVGQANSIFSLGYLHMCANNLDQAHSYFNRALTVFQSLGNKLGQANCLRNIGDIYLSTSDYEQARIYFYNALPLLESIGDKQDRANCLCSIGDLYICTSDCDQALTYFNKALLLYQSINDKIGQENCAHSFGIIAQLRGDMTEAHHWFEESIRIGEEAHAWQNVANTWYYFSLLPASPEAQQERREKSIEMQSRFLTPEQIAAMIGEQE